MRILYWPKISCCSMINIRFVQTVRAVAWNGRWNENTAVRKFFICPIVLHAFPLQAISRRGIGTFSSVIRSTSVWRCRRCETRSRWRSDCLAFRDLPWSWWRWSRRVVDRTCCVAHRCSLLFEKKWRSFERQSDIFEKDTLFGERFASNVCVCVCVYALGKSFWMQRKIFE